MTLNFPALFLGKLPSYLSRGVFTAGILSGNLTVGDSVEHPLITGRANLVEGRSLRGPTISAGMTFKGRAATIDFVHLREPIVFGDKPSSVTLDVSARGELDFADPDDLSLRVIPATAVDVIVPSAGDCLRGLEFSALPAGFLPARRIQEFGVSGNVFAQHFRISLPSANPVDPPDIFPLCPDDSERGRTLTLRIAPAFVP